MQAGEVLEDDDLSEGGIKRSHMEGYTRDLLQWTVSRSEVITLISDSRI